MALLEWQPVDLRSDPHAFEHRGDPADMVDVLTFLAELRPAWHGDAACRVSPAGDIDFFPGQGGDLKQPKARCAVCPVKGECLQYALGHPGTQGIWGGTSERERRRLRRTRQAAA